MNGYEALETNLLKYDNGATMRHGPTEDALIRLRSLE
jgi:hypothetical protein